MRRIILLTLAMSSIQPAFALNQETIIDAIQSVVMIRGYNQTGGLAYGSGVVVAKDKVITNCHIFKTTKRPWVSRGEDSYEIASVQADRWHDLCLISAPNLPFKPAKIGDGNDIKRGQEILSIGYSNGLPNPITSAGAIKTTYTFDGGNVIRSSAKFLMGASGSGIFDHEGKLLGINTFKTPGRPAYFYSLPIEWLSDLEKLPVETQFPVTGKAFWEEDDNKKPFFMQSAIPELSQDWLKLGQVAENWIKIDPKNTEAWYELGIAQFNLNDNKSAKKSFQQSLQLDENNTNSMFQLGVIAKADGDQASMHDINLAIAKIDEALAKEYSEALGCNLQC